MGIFLLDVNVLVALAWPEHEFHHRVGTWFGHNSHSGWATCPFTELAFVRILSNPAVSPAALTPQNALSVLASNTSLPDHHFWPDAISVKDALKTFHGRITGHKQLPDAYLVALALQHRGKLATLDRGIRGLGTEDAVELIK